MYGLTASCAAAASALVANVLCSAGTALWSA
jgi:hypothetical protein